MYIQVYELKKMAAEDYQRIMKRSEVETESILDDVAKVIEQVKTRGDDALVDYTREFEAGGGCV